MPIPNDKRSDNVQGPCHAGEGTRVVLEARVVSGTGGGPDKTILNSPRFLDRHGYRTICAYMYPPGDPGFEAIRLRAAELNASLFEIPDRGAWDWRVAVELLRLCRRERVTIWHGHDYKSNALGLLLKTFWPMRLVTTVHGWVKHTSRTPFYYGLDRLCLPFYERVISVSPDLHAACLKAGVPAELCVLIENGIDTVDFVRTMTRTEARKVLGLEPNRLLIGSVGRLSPEKGFPYLIEAVSRLNQAGVDVGLVIAGEGSEKDPLQRLIDLSPCRERIKLLGFRADARLVYQALDVFALASVREGLPNALLEAMALEVPVVATDIAGVPRLVESGTNGFLVPPGNTEALASALDTLLGNEATRSKFARAGRQKIEQHYSFAGRMEKIRHLYDELLMNGRNLRKPRPAPAAETWQHPQSGHPAVPFLHPRGA